MKSNLLTIEDGFYAVTFQGKTGTTVTAYYSLGRLVGVQIKDLVYVSENYWLDNSKAHIALIRKLADENIAVHEVAADTLEWNFGFYIAGVA